ncbi:MAG: TolC family protein [Mediterranea sp.]|jgi:outer membrane protein TolC|nr:TolC family protein [Mediterranea sp.]
MKRIFIILFTAIGSPVAGVYAQQPFDLQTCLATGLENNYSIRISRNEEQIGKNNATWANAGALPVIDLTGSYNGAIDNTETTVRATQDKLKDSGVFDQTFNVGLNLNWTIFDGFKITTTYRRLKELQRQGETNTRIAIEDFIASLTAEYYNYVRQTIRLKNFRYAVSLSKERLRIVEARYSIGSFSRLDLQQARVDFNADSSQYMKQQELLHTSRIRLNELMARRDLDMELHAADSIIVPNMLLSFDELWNATLLANAALLKAEQSRTLAALDLQTVNARNYPYLKLNSGYGYTLNKYEIATNRQRSNHGPHFGLTAGVNLFDGNRKRERANANIAIENARLARLQLEQSLQADMNNLWQAYQNNSKILKLERENRVAAKENHEIAMERYLLGDLSGIEMREAQKSLLDAEERILSAEYDTKLCEISLLQISGKVTMYLNNEPQ